MLTFTSGRTILSYQRLKTPSRNNTKMNTPKQHINFRSITRSTAEQGARMGGTWSKFEQDDANSISALAPQRI